MPSSHVTFFLYKSVMFLCPLTFSGELKGDDGTALFEGSWLPMGCLNVNGNAVKDGFAKRKIHPLSGIKLMIGIAGINGTSKTFLLISNHAVNGEIRVNHELLLSLLRLGPKKK